MLAFSLWALPLGEQNITDMTQNQQKHCSNWAWAESQTVLVAITASAGLFICCRWSSRKQILCKKATVGRQLLLPLGQGASQWCSVPLIPIFQWSLLCNARVSAAVCMNGALHHCAGKIRAAAPKGLHTEKPKSSGAVTMVNYSAKPALKGEK